MRNSRSLDALLPKVRQGILVATVLQPERSWYVSDLARHLRTRPSSLQREVASLVEAGILVRSKDGNRVYVAANPQCPFLSDLQGLLTKTAGIVDVLREALRPLRDRIACAFIYGSVARGVEQAASDVDLFVIGTVGLADLAPRLRSAERGIERAVNPTVDTLDEFARKARTGHHFVSTVLAAPKLFLLGSDADLVSIAGTESRAKARDEQARTRRPARRRRAGSR